MKDYAIVLNAGSSSLKFSVYHKPGASPWRLEARGQVEGIGTAAKFSAKDGADHRLPESTIDLKSVRDGRTALDALTTWLQSTYQSARLLGVGHRVVHGGPHFRGPTLVTPDVLAELRTLEPLAPLHQPHNLAAID